MEHITIYKMLHSTLPALERKIEMQSGALWTLPSASTP